MRFDPVISIGSLLAGLSVLVSVAALAYGWRKDRQFRRREYADHIRTAAGRIAVALERWQLIARQFCDDLLPTLEDAARLATEGRDPAAAARLLRAAMLTRRAEITRRIVDERLEAAYVDLYGYDPRIHVLFTAAIQRMQAIDRDAFTSIETLLIADLQGAATTDGDAIAAELRTRCADLAAAYTAATGAVIEGFRAEMLALITASDDRIIARAVDFRSVEDALPPAKVAAPADTSSQGQ
jgi:hypothetical protein